MSDEPLIRPFRALRPAAGRAGEVLAPPYDVVTTEEARRRAEGRPWSFLHVSRAEIDCPAGTDSHAPQVYERARANLQRMIDEGVLVRDARPCYYVYRMEMGGHVQTGVALAASVAAYASGRIRRHEHTLPAKVEDRARHIEAVNAQTGPVLLAFPDSPTIAELLSGIAGTDPEIDAQGDDGVRHRIWSVAEPALIDKIGAAFAALPALYIADGHHRSAAAAEVAARRGQRGAHRHFLAVAYPQGQMRILDYNRVVRDLNGLDTAALCAAIAAAFDITASDQPVRPERPGQIGMYLPGRWYRLNVRPERVPAGDPVARLDVSLLTDLLLRPILGIEDLRRDPRIDFVGGIRGLGELERRVDCGEMAVAFAMHPTRMEDLMAVADAGRVMPPKSTWFEPKLADGLLAYVLD